MTSTKITITNGEITFGRTGAGNLIAGASDGDYMLKLEEWKAAKTWKQIKFIHGPVVKVYSDYTGYTKEEAKLMLKRKYGENRYVTDKETGEQVLYVRSLADYSKKEMQLFLDRVLEHLEFECNIIVDPETRKQFQIDWETGELEELTLERT